jgi:uncharacterized protein YlxW (UPF0749 family)
MNEEMEKVEGEVIEETECVPSIEDLQEEIRSLKLTVHDYSAEIDHIRADNSVLKEAIVRLQLKSLGLME